MEELDTILADETMSADDKKAAINKFIGSNYVPTSKYTEKIDEAKTKYETLESDFTAFKNAKMTEEEKKAEAEAVQAKKFKEQSDNLSRYIIRDIFTTNGLEVDDEVMTNLVQGSPEATKVVAENVAKLLTAQKETLNNSFKDVLKTQGNKPASGNAPEKSKTETDLEALQSQFMSATNPAERAALLRQINAINK